MASVQFLLASIEHRCRIGLLLPWDAVRERQELLGDAPAEPMLSRFSGFGEFGDFMASEPLSLERAQEHNRAAQVRREAAAATAEEDRLVADARAFYGDEPLPDVYPMITGILDLEDYGDGLVPDELAPILAEQNDREAYLYMIRDRIEYANLMRRKREASEWTLVSPPGEDVPDDVSWVDRVWRLEPPRNLTWIPGASYPASSAGSKAWLDDQLAQMRINYALTRRQARRFWESRRLPRSWSSVSDDPQLRWLVRRQELLRIQFNVRRKCEALGVNPDAAGFRLYEAEKLDGLADKLLAEINAKALPRLTDEQVERYTDAFEHAVWAYGQAHKRPMPEDEVEELRHELAGACLHELDVLGLPIPDRDVVRAQDLIPRHNPRTPRHALMTRVFERPTSYSDRFTQRRPEFKYTESLVRWISEKRRAA